jgi:HD superfamily phosphodiesterase
MHNTLTPAAAETYAKELFAQTFSGAQLEWTLLHCASVAKCCEELAGDNPTLVCAAWLHDIGRTIREEHHAHESLVLAQKKFGTLDPVIADCIRNHGSDSQPQTREGALFQLADKLSLFTPASMEFYRQEDPRGFSAFYEKQHAKLAALLRERVR